MAIAFPDVSRIVQNLGGPTRVAAALGISNPSVIINWCTRNRIPVARVADMERLSGIPRAELRPDFAGIFIANKGSGEAA